MNLREEDFPTFFEIVHGHRPFKWQCRLLRHVLNEGWGAPIDLPTASGKTAVLDVAVFALALQAGDGQRRTPRRIALVVDRRIVVDDAFARASRIRDAVCLHQARELAGDDVLSAVKARLLSLGGEQPLECAALRGGIYREDRWARTPLQPVLICSTVDQIGSRLLHRGYGLSSYAWPIHAGLLGNDTLVILDEAHCSRPFLETLGAVDRLRRVARAPMTSPWGYVPMTATPPPGLQPAFRLYPDERAEPALARRLCASKPARLQVARTAGDQGLAGEILAELCATGSQWVGRGLTTLVVVNRVRAARLIFDDLQRRTSFPPSRQGALQASVVLLTGRVRPVDRARLLHALRTRIMAGRDREAAVSELPLIVVATQCVEVGADLDVDVLVTEACPLDSLRQRFGRLDRLGHRGESAALIVCRPEYAVDGKATMDPVYGDRIARTWKWLHSVASSNTIDCSIAAMEALAPPAHELAALSRSAPLMFPAYCDLWVQTSPMPSVSPDPAIFLHGPEAGPPDVGLVWRADLDAEARDSWASTIAACPPSAGEVLPLPLHVARAFLAGAAVDPGTDIEGESVVEDVDLTTDHVFALRWAGPDGSAVVDQPDQVRPGDVLVLPCSAGGADAQGWSGRSADVPADIADAARAEARRTPMLRVHRALTSAYWEGRPPAGWAELCEQGDEEEGGLAERELRATVSALLPAWCALAVEPALRTTLEALVADRMRIRVELHPYGRGLVVSGSRRLGVDAVDFGDEDDLSSLSPVGLVGLDGHLNDVRDWARRIGTTADLPADLVEALAVAGYLHDLGKCDPRFQAWLVGGDRLRVDRRRPLAKSDRIRTGAAAALARRRSGYPEGARHELLSVRLAESGSLLPKDPIHRDLVLHLVASHHGRCRPWAPVVPDARPLTVTHALAGHSMQARTDTGLEALDSGVAERFWRLVRHFGWWGLSYLEACLRLADHRASEKPGTAEEVA